MLANDRIVAQRCYNATLAPCHPRALVAATWASALERHGSRARRKSGLPALAIALPPPGTIAYQEAGRVSRAPSRDLSLTGKVPACAPGGVRCFHPENMGPVRHPESPVTVALQASLGKNAVP